jgi:hypothetical protein
MDEQTFEDALVELFQAFDFMDDEDRQEVRDSLGVETLPDVAAVETFNGAGVLTMNKGLVLRMADGSEFQLTIVRSR